MRTCTRESLSDRLFYMVLWWQVYNCIHLSKHKEAHTMKRDFYLCEYKKDNQAILKTQNMTNECSCIT